MCLNSGSEAVGLAARIADTNTKTLTDPGARYAGRKIKRVVVKGSFHGRTDLPLGNHHALLESIETKLMPLPDDTIFVCGHGPISTIGRERATNPFLT